MGTGPWDLTKSAMMTPSECVSFFSPSLQTRGLGHVSLLWSGAAVLGTSLASTPRCSVAVTRGVAGPSARLQKCALSGDLVSAMQRLSTFCWSNLWLFCPALVIPQGCTDMVNHQHNTQRNVAWDAGFCAWGSSKGKPDAFSQSKNLSLSSYPFSNFWLTP